MAVKKKTVSLVLGSGGARGLAHIGIIHWLEENGYEIKAISGSSMGALIGGIYGAGKLDTYTNWVRALNKRDVIRLLDFAYSRKGVFSGERIIGTLKKLLGDTNIEELPISFTAVACDLDHEKEVWFRKGSLFDAIRASISIPTVFTPVQHNGRMLVDGGLLNPIPIAPTMMDMTDMTIAVNLSGKHEDLILNKTEEDKLEEVEYSYFRGITRFLDSLQEKFNYKDEDEDETNVFDIVTQSFDSMQNSIARFKLASYHPDYIIDIPVNACATFDFHRADEMIALGYERAEQLFRPKVNC